METNKYRITKYACYTAYFTMSSIFCVPPLLFVTFRELYGISYTLLGTLVLVNFCTQLGIDLVFTACSRWIDAKKVVRAMPLVTALGMLIYALIPNLFPEAAYGGLLTGTIVFSVSAGFSEVLLSPVIAAIPSENPQRDMSMLHSLYAFGAFTMIVISTVFLSVFGAENWLYLFLFLAALPVIAAVLFMLSPMPDMSGGGTEPSQERREKGRMPGLLLCVACIFFGSCAENAMSNWVSTYAENALGIGKAVGDILGAAMFAILLGVARIAYAKFGKNICKTLLLSMIGAAVCYLTVGLSSGTVLPFVACMLTGLFTSMLWPGSLIMMEEKLPGATVSAFALMAAGGDLGASIAPQLLGVVIDKVSASELGIRLAHTLNISPEQIGLRAGMLLTALFPMIGIGTVLAVMRYFRKPHKENALSKSIS